VDVELLLETLERLDTREKDILLKFHNISGYLLSGYALKEPLKDSLKDLMVPLEKRSNLGTHLLPAHPNSKRE
jgi:hypothetical protein